MLGRRKAAAAFRGGEPMKLMYRILILTLFGYWTFASGAKPVRVLLLSDGGHERQQDVLRLRQCLAQNGPFEVRLIEEIAALNAAALSAYDVLLLDYSGHLGKQAEQAVERFVHSGKGLVTVRGLTCAFCAARGTGGAASPPAPARVLELRWTDNRHPVSAGLPDSFLTVDRLRPSPTLVPAARILATLRREAGGAAEPLVWTHTYGKGRIFQTALGENPALLEEPGYVNLLIRGLEWAATGAVTLPVRRSARHESKEAVRALIVTGGHDHRASFYGLFEGHEDIHAMVDPHPFPYRQSLVKRYDVLVLYDSMQEITEPQQRVLREFLESGKGLVVVHHALVDYCNWQWWYEEVVGGRWYQTEDKLPRWKTTWKEDVELVAYPVRDHPVLEGVGPLHLWDETYKGMWLSPHNTVLMRTDEPSSDGPVVWISPYPKSRVVVIQLGHDDKTHWNPGFRRLIRNAVVWSAAAKKQ
jgi:type 1 glutamine amidotransferase